MFNPNNLFFVMLKHRIFGIAKQSFKLKAVNHDNIRRYSQSLKDSLVKVIPGKQAEAADLRKNFGSFVLDTCTVDKVCIWKCEK